MPKKKKLKLENLSVTSFITSEEIRNVRGMTAAETNCKVTECLSLLYPFYCDGPDTDTCNTCQTCVTCVDSCNGTCSCNESCDNPMACLPTRTFYPECPSDPGHKICI